MINNNHNKYIYMIYFLKIPKQSPLDPNVFWKASDLSWLIYTRMRDLPWFAIAGPEKNGGNLAVCQNQ